jgi:RNA 2',3'-cyclic 3'-phosphodiesterase
LTRRQADEFAKAVADIDLPPPRVRISGTGSFGGKLPHLVYAAIEPDDALEALARAHDRAARAIGLPADTRKYVPHVTLARLDGATAEQVARFLERTGDLRIPAFWPERTVLMSSREGGGGPYGVVDAFPFPGHAP